MLSSGAPLKSRMASAAPSRATKVAAILSRRLRFSRVSAIEKRIHRVRLTRSNAMSSMRLLLGAVIHQVERPREHAWLIGARECATLRPALLDEHVALIVILQHRPPRRLVETVRVLAPRQRSVDLGALLREALPPCVDGEQEDA